MVRHQFPPPLRQGIALAVLVLCPTLAMAAEIAVVADLRIRPYVEALAGFKEVTHGTIHVYENQEDGSLEDEHRLAERIRERNPGVILAIGQEALHGVVSKNSDIITVFAMAYPSAAISQKTNLTGITLESDPVQLADVLDQLFPGPMRVGTIYDPNTSEQLVSATRAALDKHGKTLDAAPITGSESPVEQAKAILNGVDAFWMVPDQTIHDPDVVRFLLFASRKQGKPLIGPSGKYVKAGALLALTPDSHGIGREAAELADRLLAGTPVRDLPIRPTSHTTLFIHKTIAAEQGIVVPESLKQKVRYVP